MLSSFGRRPSAPGANPRTRRRHDARPDPEGRVVRRIIRAAAVLCAVLASPTAWGQQPTTIPVGTVAAEQRPITRATDFVGRVEAIERVDIRARVTGFLQDVLFKDGSTIKKGEVLYRIEPETFQAAVQQAQGALLEAQAKYANAVAQRQRTEELVRTDAASRALLDQRVAAEKSAQGEIVVAHANLTTAKINLGYTEISSPIAGEVGRTAVTVGNVVGPNSGPLTTIVSRDPMYVTFPVSQREFLAVQKVEERKARAGTLAVRIRFSDGSTYNHPGRIDFVNVMVDQATDTVLVRAVVPNPDGRLIDGQLVQVAVEAENPVEKILVPQAALIVDQQGPYVFVVVGGKAEVRRVKLGGDSGAYAIIEQGVKAGEQVVVQGMESLRPGTQVLASPTQPPPPAG
jgi:membrane fusion protein, multidrug efflux system